jgi:hypothetical protein
METDTDFTRRSMARAARGNEHRLAAWAYGDDGIITAACASCGANVTIFYRGKARPWVEHELDSRCAIDAAFEISVS